jgi:hypothetical protein
MYTIFHWLYSPHELLPLIFQFHNRFTDVRTPWTGDQLVERSLSAHRTTQTQNKDKQTHTKHPCLVWDSNPRSRLPSKRRQVSVAAVPSGPGWTPPTTKRI